MCGVSVTDKFSSPVDFFLRCALEFLSGVLSCGGCTVHAVRPGGVWMGILPTSSYTLVVVYPNVCIFDLWREKKMVLLY